MRIQVYQIKTPAEKENILQVINGFNGLLRFLRLF